MTASPGVNPPPAYPETPTATGPRRLLRSRTNRMFAGVCGGLAEAYGADATAVRLLTVIFGVITGIFPVLIIYLIAAIVIPDRDAGDVHGGARAPVIVTRGQGGLIAGIALVGFGIVALVNEWFDVDWALLWPVALIVLGGAVVVAARR